MLSIFKSKSFQNIICLLILASAFVYMFLNWRERKEALKEVVYIRVKIDSINTSSRGGPFFYFKFKINDTLYKTSDVINNWAELAHNKKINEFVGYYFYAKVSKEKPKYSKLLIEYKVVDTTLAQPKSGWKKLPEKIKSNYGIVYGNDDDILN